MGRLSEFFDQHRDNVEEAVSQALSKADATIEALDRKVKDLEQRLRDVAGEAPSRDAEVTKQNAQGDTQDGVVTSDQSGRKQTRSKK